MVACPGNVARPSRDDLHGTIASESALGLLRRPLCTRAEATASRAGANPVRDWGMSERRSRLRYSEKGASCRTPSTTKASTTSCHLAKRPALRAVGRISISQLGINQARRAVPAGSASTSLANHGSPVRTWSSGASTRRKLTSWSIQSGLPSAATSHKAPS